MKEEMTAGREHLEDKMLAKMETSHQKLMWR
jgi:hypothetical protein